MKAENQRSEQGHQGIPEGVNLSWWMGELQDMKDQKIDQDGTKKVQKKIEEMVSKNIHSSQKVIEAEAGHQQRAVAAGLGVNSTSQLGVHKKLGNPAGVLDKRISLDDMVIIVLKSTLKRIGINQEGQ